MDVTFQIACRICFCFVDYERSFDELPNLSASLPNFENTTRSVQAFESMSCDDSKVSVGIFWSTLKAAATHGMTWSFYGIGNSEGYLTPPLGSRVPPELWIE